jgi:hypothetical protein
MAKPARGSKANRPLKLTREQKKQARQVKRQSRRENWQAMRQAFTLTRKNDNRFIPYLALFGVLAIAVSYVVVFFLTGSPWIPIPVAILFGLIAAMLVFSRRVRSSTYAQAEGQPGAAGWMLQNQIRGDWRSELGIAATTQFDSVHRLIGRPGVVLVGEGAPHRVRPLIAQEKKKISRIAGDTPIYDFIVGADEGSVPLSKLQSRLLKLPQNLSKEQVNTLDKRMQALGSARPAMPQGPMPAGAKMRNVQRAARRRT